MTRDEFDKGIIYLSSHFPNFSPPNNTLNAWYVSTKHLPLLTYKFALSLICKREPQWWPDMNLAGVITKYESEAKDMAKKHLDKSNKPVKLLDEPRCSPEEARRNVEIIMAMISGIGEKIK